MAPSTRSRTKRPTGVPSQATSSLTFLRLDSDLRQVGERRAYLLGRVLEVLELPIHIALVRTEIEVAVAGEVEGDGLRLTRLLAPKRLVDDDADRVCRLRCG